MTEDRGANESILRTIDAMRDEIVAMLQSLVKTPSITGDEVKVAELVASFCRDLDLDVKIVEAEKNRPNVIARWDTGLPGPSLLLNDHLDIVPPGPLENWSYPPFAAEIANGRVYGRGTIDTKSGLTTILMATKAIREIGLPLRGMLTLVFSCDEEVGGEKGMQFLCRQGHIHADMAVVAEPTTMQIEIATKGRLNIEITTRGVATHGARPWLGHNAIEDMMEVIAGLRHLAQNLSQRSHPLLGSATLSVGRIDGGTVPNMVPNKCILGLDRRVLPTETPEMAEAEIQTILDDLKTRIPGFEASMKRIVWWPGYTLNDQAPIVDLTCRAFEKVMGRHPKVAGKDAGTDASWINVLAGIPVVMFSPGDGLKAMNADENVGIDDLIAATKVMAQIVHDILASK